MNAHLRVVRVWYGCQASDRVDVVWMWCGGRQHLDEDVVWRLGEQHVLNVLPDAQAVTLCGGGCNSRVCGEQHVLQVLLDAQVELRRQPSVVGEDLDARDLGPCELVAPGGSKVKGGEHSDFGGSSLEPPRRCLGAQWLRLTLGVPSCPELPGAR